MEYSSKTRTLSAFGRDMKNGKYSTKHKFQRKEDQWKNKAKAELIDSLLRHYPIDPIRTELKSDNIRYIFDGVQRASILNGYLKDEFPLLKNMEPVIIDGKEYDLSRKKFSQLPEEVQADLNAQEIIVYTFENCTEKDIREMFKRQNNGVALTNTQKRTAIECDEVSSIVFGLADHPFFEKILKKSQLKKDIQRDFVREILMLSETTNEHEFLSFKPKDIDNFVIWYKDNINEEKISLIKIALDKLDEYFEELKVNMVSIPMIVYSAYRILKDKKSFSKLVDSINDFIENYDSNEEYKKLCAGGTTSSAMVRGRFDYWRNIVKTL